MGEKKRTHSAAALLSSGGGPLSLLSCPTTRSAVLQQWLTSMRDRGIIVSDAQIRYNRWLALSESNRPISPTMPHKRHPHAIELSSRPVTAPASINGTYIVEHTRTSRMRLEKLRAKKPEADYNKIAQSRKIFDQHCNHMLSSPIMAENCSDHETTHEFLVGSRYNCAHHIDSRSLYRLGVYVPRKNVGSAFINPGGILPPNYNRARYKTHSKDITPSEGYFVNFKIKRKESCVSVSSSLNSTAIFSNEPGDQTLALPPLPPSPPLPPYRHLPSITSKSEGNIGGRRKDPTEPKTMSCIELHVPRNTPVHSAPSSAGTVPKSIPPQVAVPPIPLEDLIDSAEGDISNHPNNTLEDVISDGEGSKTNLAGNENEEVVEEEKDKEDDEKEENLTQQTTTISSIQHDPPDETTNKTASSTLFVDMTKLENQDEEEDNKEQ